ncbi:MAG: hypothetical protein ACLROI_06985 [Beduini sp.]|uniref:hypothetical protein n=1 Tax=Beduini sp. TaxID=1922300 RepID=UPI0011C6E9C3
MKLLKLCMSVLLMFSCIGCGANGIDKLEFLVKGTMNDEDYIIKKDEFHAKVMFYAQNAEFEELSLIVENTNDQTVVMEKTVLKRDLSDETVCEVSMENNDELGYLSIGIDGDYERIEIGSKWDNVFVECYHVSQKESASLDTMQFLEYKGYAAETVDLFAIKKLPSDKEYIVKLAVA